MKKILSLALAMIMMFSLVGCKKSETNIEDISIEETVVNYTTGYINSTEAKNYFTSWYFFDGEAIPTNLDEAERQEVEKFSSVIIKEIAKNSSVEVTETSFEGKSGTATATIKTINYEGFFEHLNEKVADLETRMYNYALEEHTEEDIAEQYDKFLDELTTIYTDSIKNSPTKEIEVKFNIDINEDNKVVVTSETKLEDAFFSDLKTFVEYVIEQNEVYSEMITEELGN